MFAKTTGKSQSMPTIVGRGCKILGDLHFDGELHLEGEVIGSLTCKTLVICAGAVVSGDISAATATIGGRVSGQITAETVDIGATAEIDGDIHCNRIGIAPGARVEGKIHRRQPPQALAESIPNLLSLAVST